MQITALSVRTAKIKSSSKNSFVVSLDDINGADFVACCEDDLLREIIVAAGDAFCCEALDLEMPE